MSAADRYSRDFLEARERHLRDIGRLDLLPLSEPRPVEHDWDDRPRLMDAPSFYRDTDLPSTANGSRASS